MGVFIAENGGDGLIGCDGDRVDGGGVEEGVDGTGGGAVGGVVEVVGDVGRVLVK